MLVTVLISYIVLVLYFTEYLLPISNVSTHKFLLQMDYKRDCVGRENIWAMRIWVCLNVVIAWLSVKDIMPTRMTFKTLKNT